MTTRTIKDTLNALLTKSEDVLTRITHRHGTVAGLDYISIIMLAYGVTDTLSVNTATRKVMHIAQRGRPVKIEPYGETHLDINAVIELASTPMPSRGEPYKLPTLKEMQANTAFRGIKPETCHNEVVALALIDVIYSLLEETDSNAYRLKFINGVFILDIEDYGVFNITSFLELVGYPVPFHAVKFCDEIKNKLNSMALIAVDFPRPLSYKYFGLL